MVSIQHQVSHRDGEYIPLLFDGQLGGSGISLGIDLVIGSILVDVVDAFNDGSIEPLPDWFSQLHKGRRTLQLVQKLLHGFEGDRAPEIDDHLFF